MRILHTGDLHLDSAFCSFGAKDAERQREYGRDLLRRIFDCAREESCELMLISGDLFDSGFVSGETGELFCRLVEENDICVAVAPGNHDPYSATSFYAKIQSRLGDRLILFTSAELQIFDIEEKRVRLFGYGFTSAAITESPLADIAVPEDDGYLRILCAHADIFSPISRYAPITLEQLERFDFDYVALGHVHNKWDEAELDGRVRYCGFGEGRSFDELGEGGVWIVDLNKEEISCERKILSQRAFYIENVSVTEEDDIASLRDKICALANGKDSSQEIYLRVVLEGSADEALVSDICAQTERIADECGVEFLEIQDETMPMLDGEYLEKDMTLRGALYRTLRPKLLSSDPIERRKAIKALRIGLAAIDGKNIFSAVGKGGQR